VVNDSLSRRALRRQSVPIKVKPKKQITVYLPENCTSCDSIMKPLKDSKYLYTSFDLGEKPEIKAQLGMPISQVDSLQTPLFSLGGLIYPKIKNYEELLEKLLKE
jgi:arsenate reductase-like glutaredoxin family protein